MFYCRKFPDLQYYYNLLVVVVVEQDGMAGTISLGLLLYVNGLHTRNVSVLCWAMHMHVPTHPIMNKRFPTIELVKSCWYSQNCTVNEQLFLLLIGPIWHLCNFFRNHFFYKTIFFTVAHRKTRKTGQCTCMYLHIKL